MDPMMQQADPMMNNSNPMNPMSSERMPLDKIISTPLTASFETQRKLSMSVIDFMKSVGFDMPESEHEWGVPVYVNFRYEVRTGEGEIVTNTVRLPILNMLNIPSLNLDTLSVDFCVCASRDCNDKVSGMSGYLCGEDSNLGKYKFSITAKTSERKADGVTTLLSTLKNSV